MYLSFSIAPLHGKQKTAANLKNTFFNQGFPNICKYQTNICCQHTSQTNLIKITVSMLMIFPFCHFLLVKNKEMALGHSLTPVEAPCSKHFCFLFWFSKHCHIQVAPLLVILVLWMDVILKHCMPKKIQNFEPRIAR